MTRPLCDRTRLQAHVLTSLRASEIVDFVWDSEIHLSNDNPFLRSFACYRCFASLGVLPMLRLAMLAPRKRT